MKKLFSVILTLLMIFSFTLPAFAATVNPESSKSQIPVIRVLGDGEPMYDAEGNKLFHIRTSFSEGFGSEEEDGSSELMKSVANVLMPFLIDGLLNDNWDVYYENLEREIGEFEGNEFTVSREIFDDGRNVCRINGEMATVARLNASQ